MPKNILLTGTPGCGKTTVVRRVVERLSGRRLAGFYTEEVRHGGKRVAFEAVGLGGDRIVLAHVHIASKHHVGRYGVDLEWFESLARRELRKPFEEVDLFVIDEIGRMECLSEIFVELATRVLDGPVPVLATVAAKGSGFIERAKKRSDVQVTVVTAENRDSLPVILADRLRQG